MLRKILAVLFVFFMALAFYQCAQKGRPTGGPKDETPPVLLKAEPENMTINFKTQKIRLYFDELVKLKDVQEQLIVSPPLKYQPLLSPQGGASKFIEITINSTTFPMVKQDFMDSNFIDGCVYIYDTQLNDTGIYSYDFSCSDGIFTASAGPFVGPVVETSPLFGGMYIEHIYTEVGSSYPSRFSYS